MQYELQDYICVTLIEGMPPHKGGRSDRAWATTMQEIQKSYPELNLEDTICLCGKMFSHI